MPNYLIEYRLRIRNAGNQFAPVGTVDDVVFTSVAGTAAPYIAAPPSGDGQELDPVTGAVRTGAYVVEIVDVATGTDGTGTVRTLTNRLEDTYLRQQLLSRFAYLETRTDGGAWASLIAGYVTNIRLVSAMRYAITIGDTRRVERVPVLAYSDTVSPTNIRGCLIGGPVTADFGPVKFRGGWRYEVTGVSGRVVSVAFRSGYSPTLTGARVTDIQKLYRTNVLSTIFNLAQTFAPVPIGPFGGGRVVLDLTLYIGTTETNAKPTRVQLALPGWIGGEFDSFGLQYMDLYWPTTEPLPLPSGGDSLWISMAQTTISELSPLLLDAHPVDIVLSVWNQNNIYYDAGGAWITTIRDLIGADVRLAVRLTESISIDEFLRNAIYGPFGITARTNLAGQQELVASRIRTTTLPTLTIAAADLRDQSPMVFEVDEKTAVASVGITQQALKVWDSGPVLSPDVPSDGLAVTEITQRIANAAAQVYGARDIEYRMAGMVHNVASFQPVITEFLRVVGQETIDRFQAGAASAEVALVASAASAAAQVGDEVYLNAPHYPNRNYRIGESTVGARIMQVVRRTETPAGPLLRLLDSGIAAQPVSPAATITLAANANLPELVAAYTITNAATINAGGALGVEVEWATGAAAPTGNGQSHAVYAAGEVPTAAVDLPAVTGSALTVHVRARTLQLGRRPSAWTAWSSVTLTATPQPGAITASGATTTSVDIAWSNTSSTYPIAIFAYQGSSAPANWVPYKLNTIAAGSTSTTVRALTGPSAAWVLALAYETPTGLGPVRTVATTTGSTAPTSDRPAGIAVIPTLDDAQLPQGIALGLYPTQTGLDIIVERSTTSGSGFAEVGRVSGSSETFADLLPRDNTTYYYRLRHALGGFTQSAPTGEVFTIARGLPSPLVRPDPVVPTVSVQVSETATTATLTLDIVDPQGRVSQVRFRHDSGSGFGAWTVDPSAPYTYTQTIPVTGFLRIEYEVKGFDADGIDRVLAGGIESFDRGTSADLVSAVGSFGIAGNFILAIAADTDTASIKYVLSTVSQPNLATVQAASPINGRNITQTFAGPYDLGTVLYVSILAYTGTGGTGTESGLFEYQYQRMAGAVQCLASETTSTPTTSQVVANALLANGTSISGGEVQLAALYGPTTGAATIASGAAVGVWVTAPGVWTFNRGAPLSGPTQARFRARRGPSNPNETDDDTFEIVEEGRDTKPLISRARVIASTATDITVRVAVVTPSPYAAASTTITYSTTGLGTVSPTSPQTITSGTAPLQIPEPVGTYVDFTVPRPAFAAAAGGITFTATASGFAPDTDPVVVPPQDKDFTPPTFSPTLTLTSTTGQVSWPAVASGVTVEGSTDNVTFTTASGTTYPTFATGRNAFGGATKFLFVRAYNASGIYTPTTAFAVPPQDPTVPAITRFTSASLTIRYATDPTRPNEFQLDYTISNFPTGGSVNAVILQDGVDIGIPVTSGTPSQTQGFWAAPVALNASGSPAIEWLIYLEVLDSTGTNVEATSKSLAATSYV